jgi:anti-sigma regulatory factor (Ser/Thr protein kinase)
MTTRLVTGAQAAEGTFRHEALFYAGPAGFLDTTAVFIRGAVMAREPCLVVVSDAKIRMLRSELGAEADGVQFADMADVGRNPARIIPAWREFVADQAARGKSRFRGIGEPIWPGRSPDELVECERHESLLNLAFEGAPAWWLICSYDTEALPPPVIEEALRNHPSSLQGGRRRESALYRGLASVARPFDRPLPEPACPTEELWFNEGDIQAVRSFVSNRAVAYGIPAGRRDDLVLAADEVATNSVRHGGGGGVVRTWQGANGANEMICEVRDSGRIDHPLAGRERPGADQVDGFGLWLANQLCDLVQIRSFPSGSVVRLHVWSARPSQIRADA